MKHLLKLTNLDDFELSIIETFVHKNSDKDIDNLIEDIDNYLVWDFETDKAMFFTKVCEENILYIGEYLKIETPIYSFKTNLSEKIVYEKSSRAKKSLEIKLPEKNTKEEKKRKL